MDYPEKVPFNLSQSEVTHDSFEKMGRVGGWLAHYNFCGTSLVECAAYSSAKHPKFKEMEAGHPNRPIPPSYLHLRFVKVVDMFPSYR